MESKEIKNAQGASGSLTQGSGAAPSTEKCAPDEKLGTEVTNRAPDEKSPGAAPPAKPLAQTDTAACKNLLAANTAMLAFIGDAVYETFARVHVYEKGLMRPDRLNQAAIAYVRAEAQAYAFDRLQPELTDAEAALARRGKNHKITSMPKNVDPMVYKKATGFETLIGYLELAGDRDRLTEIVQKTFTYIEEKDFSHVKR